jgi:hypothetical protein
MLDYSGYLVNEYIQNGDFVIYLLKNVTKLQRDSNVVIRYGIVS